MAKLEEPIKKKSGRGGARPGAGRKIISKSGKKTTISVCVEPAIIAAMNAKMLQLGINKSEFVTLCIQEFLKK